MASRTIYNVQVLRAVAAGSVACSHLEPMLVSSFGRSVDFGVGAFGVDIFFVISGFVMYYSSAIADRPIAPFLVARFFRIVPLYWLSTLILVAIYYAGFHPNGLNYFEPYMLLQSMFFVQTLFPDGRYDLILSLGWTLLYELFFYLVFACSFRFATPGRSLAAVAGVFMTLVVVGAAFPAIPHRIAYFLSPIILEFLLGGALALMLLRWGELVASIERRLAGSIAAIAVLAIVVGCAWVLATPAGLIESARDGVRAFVWGPAAFLIVGGIVALEKCGFAIRSRFALLLGAASYVIYLFQPVAMQTTVKALAHVIPNGTPGAAALAGLCALGATVAVAVAIHLTVELRLVQAGKQVIGQMSRRRPIAHAPLPATGQTPSSFR
jgi:peptidoglycan/LPS O-acetylase OafA/YrhL